MRKKVILMLSWRDIKNPLMGGAEVFTHEVLKRVNKDKYKIIHISPSVTGQPNREMIDGVKYLRFGSLKSVIFYAFLYYRKHAKNIDIVIDQCNTFRFFTKFWVPKNKRVFLIFQLCRELWDVMLKPPISTIGRIMETPMLKLNSDDITITESLSVKKELIQIGFKEEKIHIDPIGLAFEPWEEKNFFPKEKEPTFIFVGRCVKTKGIDQILEAFGRFKREYKEGKLWIVGSVKEDMWPIMLPILEKHNLSYGKEIDKDVVYWGFVSEDKKLELQSRAKALLFPSMREGWGMIVTEAAAVGTPSVVYNTTGCCDAVDYGSAGYLCMTNCIDELLAKMINIVENEEEYEMFRKKSHAFSKEFSWNTSALIFEQIMDEVISRKDNKKNAK